MGNHASQIPARFLGDPLHGPTIRKIVESHGDEHLVKCVIHGVEDTSADNGWREHQNVCYYWHRPNLHSTFQVGIVIVASKTVPPELSIKVMKFPHSPEKVRQLQIMEFDQKLKEMDDLLSTLAAVVQADCTGKTTFAQFAVVVQQDPTSMRLRWGSCFGNLDTFFNNPSQPAVSSPPSATAISVISSDSKFCAQCGTAAPADTNFCSKCGKKFDSKAEKVD